MNKLNYEEFKQQMAENLIKYLPEEYRDAEVKVKRISKINFTADTLIIRIKGQKAAPNLYLDDVWEMYRKTGDLQTIAENAANYILRAIKDVPKEVLKIESLLKPEELEKRIILQLINAEWNKELLEKLPHRKFLDLAVVYRLAVSTEELASTLVSHEMLEKIGGNYSEEQLFELAFENTRNLFHPQVEEMKEIVEKMAKELKVVIPEDVAECLDIVDFRMLMLRTEKNAFGAVAILYPEVLKEAAEKLKEDFYILPASTEECIAVPIRGESAEEVEKMVQDTNRKEVPVAIRLSDNVYRYKVETGELVVEGAEK